MENKSIRRGSTPIHCFNLPCVDSIETAKIHYRQKGRRAICKEAVVNSEGCCLMVMLSEKETLFFRAGDDIMIQMSALMKDGSIRLSKIQTAECTECISK